MLILGFLGVSVPRWLNLIAAGVVFFMPFLSRLHCKRDKNGENLLPFPRFFGGGARLFIKKPGRTTNHTG